MKVKVWQVTLVLVLLAGILAGCGTAASPSTDGATDADTGVIPAERAASEAGGGSTANSGAVLNESYEGALPASSQLALGTFLLAETENAVSPQQAQTLLPLWQVIQSGTLKSETETGAVLKQIEGAMTPEQLSAIVAMQLTAEDMGTWAREQGVSLGGPGTGTGGFAPPEGMTEEQLAEMRAARESGEGGFGPPEGMSQEDLEAMRATAEASGMTRPEGAGGMGGGQLAALAGSLVELLSNLASS